MFNKLLWDAVIHLESQWCKMVHRRLCLAGVGLSKRGKAKFLLPPDLSGTVQMHWTKVSTAVIILVCCIFYYTAHLSILWTRTWASIVCYMRMIYSNNTRWLENEYCGENGWMSKCQTLGSNRCEKCREGYLAAQVDAKLVCFPAVGLRKIRWSGTRISL